MYKCIDLKNNKIKIPSKQQNPAIPSHRSFWHEVKRLEDPNNHSNMEPHCVPCPLSIHEKHQKAMLKFGKALLNIQAEGKQWKLPGRVPVNMPFSNGQCTKFQILSLFRGRYPNQAESKQSLKGKLFHLYPK